MKVGTRPGKRGEKREEPGRRNREASGRQPEMGSAAATRFTGRYPIPEIASAIAALVGCLVLTGWALNLGFLKRIIPGAVGMNPVTAICFILLGVSLWLLRKEAGGRWRWAARALALVVALAGLIKLTQIMAGWEYGIDQLIFPEKVDRETAVVGIPNRIAPNTALNLVLLGAAALFLDWQTRRGRWPVQYFILVSIVASMLAIVGYVYGVKHFVGVFHYVPMALHTGLTFVAIAIGFLYARPDRGLMRVFTSDTTGGAVARRLLPAAILLPIALGWLRLEGERLGFYSTYFGLALFTLSMMLAFTLIVGLNAHQLHQNDAGRRRVEEDLRESNLLRQAILNSANYTIISTSPDGTILTFNSEAERSLGYSVDEVIGKLTPAIIHDPREVAARAEELSRELGVTVEPGFEAFVAKARLGAPDENEWTYVRKDGSHFPVLLSVTALRDAEDEITGFVGVGSDLTERKRADEEISRQTDLLSTLHDTALNLTNRLDLDDVIEDIARRAAELLESSSSYVSTVDEPDGEELVMRAGVGIVRDYVGIRIKSGEGFNGKVWQTGEPAVMNVPYDSWSERSEQAKATGMSALVAAPIRSGGKVVGVIGVGDEQEGRAFGDKEVAALEQFAGLAAVALDNSQLYAAVQEELAERTRTQRKLKAFSVELQRSNQELQDFASIASHDLQEPLRKVRAFGDRLEAKYAGDLDARGLDYLDRMQNAAERMQILINDLLTFSRVTSKAQPFVEVDLSKVVREVLSDLETQVEQTGGRVETGELPALDAATLPRCASSSRT